MGNVANRRSFLKSSIFVALAISSTSASMLNAFDSPKDSRLDFKALAQNRLTYFLKDSSLGFNPDIKADKILVINNDISDIYNDLKTAFSHQAIIGSISSEASFFVITRMAYDYGLRVVYDDYQDGIHQYIIAPKGVTI